MRTRRRYALAPLFALSLGACRMMGMRSAPEEYLQATYQSAASHYVTIDGTRVHYRIEGNPLGPTLVLMHGVVASLHTWDGWVDELGAKYRIVRMDMPGFGLSAPLASGDYTPEYGAAFFEQTRRALGLERFHLVGNSLGGFLAWYYACKYPEHVGRLILIDPVAYPQELPFIMRFTASRVGGWMAQQSSPRFILAKNLRSAYGDGSHVRHETVVRYHDLLLAPGHRRAMVAYFRALRSYASDERIAREVKSLRTPTLLMWGGKDRWVPPALISRWQEDVKGLTVRVYPEAGHIPMEEFPERTARDADAFLSASEDVAASVRWDGFQALF